MKYNFCVGKPEGKKIAKIVSAQSHWMLDVWIVELSNVQLKA